MFGTSDSIGDDFYSFRENNISSSIFSSPNAESQIMKYMLFIESRISNDLTLLSNPSLCERLNIDKDLLEGELGALIESRQKISISSKNEKTR